MLRSMEGQSEKSTRMANLRFDRDKVLYSNWHPRSVRVRKLSIVGLTTFVVATFLNLSYFNFRKEVKQTLRLSKGN